MTKPVCAQKGPYVVNVEEGKTYFYCTCGQSENQPFCDGKHKNGDFRPHAYTAEKSGDVYFCGCRASENSPLCDGKHKSI